MRFLFLTLFILSLTPGCKERNPEPEKLDPIFQDLESELQSAKDELKGANTDAQRQKEKWEKAKPQTRTAEPRMRAYFKAKKNIRKAEQKVRFYEARILSRKIWARENYLKAWHKGEDWKPNVDVNRYFLNKKLQAASRNWNQKVPKLKSRIVDYNAKLLETQIAQEKAMLDAEIGR